MKVGVDMCFEREVRENCGQPGLRVSLLSADAEEVEHGSGNEGWDITAEGVDHLEAAHPHEFIEPVCISTDSVSRAAR